MNERIVLAYSGSSSDAAALGWLAETSTADVVTLTLDIGQDRDLEETRRQALASGAIRAHVLDARDEFAADCLLPALRSRALDGDGVFTLRVLARPLVARTLVELAGIERAAAVAHGATGTAIDAAVAALDASLPVIAPRRGDIPVATRARELLRRCAPIPPQPRVVDGGMAVDTNLAGRVVIHPAGSGAHPSANYRLTADPEAAQTAEASIDIDFEGDRPVALNGVPMPVTELVESLTLIAGQHGIGRSDRLVDGAAGPLRELCEAPAVTVLLAAYAALQSSDGGVRLRLFNGQHATRAIHKDRSHLVNHT